MFVGMLQGLLGRVIACVCYFGWLCLCLYVCVFVCAGLCVFDCMVGCWRAACVCLSAGVWLDVGVSV